MRYEEEAERTAVWLRAFFMGPTGSGKSRGALALADAVARVYGGLKVTLANTETGRGKLYADRFKFSYIAIEEEEDFAPERFIAAIDVAEKNNPGGILIIDSASHEWMGRGGVLSLADRFGNWKDVRPRHNAFVERIAQAEMHVIVCCRAKMKYGVEEEDVPGRSKPKQNVTMLGVGPIQSDDFQYEFNLVGRFDMDHTVAFSGHVDQLVDTTHDLVENCDAVARDLCSWLSDGAPLELAQEATEEDVAELLRLLNERGIEPDKIEAGLAAAKRQNRGKLSPEYVAEQIAKSKGALEVAAKKAKAEPAEETVAA